MRGVDSLRAVFLIRFLLPIFCFPLSGCGFHPVYGAQGGDGSPVAEQLNQVAIDPIPDHPGQMLRNDLIDRMYGKGRPAQPLYHLAIKLRIAEEDLGTLVNATTSLAAIHTSGDYALKDANDKTLAHGTVVSTASYDKLGSMYGTVAAHDGAVERTIREVSEQLTARLSLYFSDPPPP
jgi:LPS-assembly lipoprotein